MRHLRSFDDPNYDGQGKSRAREAHDSADMLRTVLWIAVADILRTVLWIAVIGLVVMGWVVWGLW